MPKQRDSMTGIETTDDLSAVQRKARYGHRSYLYWRGADGQLRYALYHHSAIKAAILDVGCHGRFFWYDSSGTSHIARSFHYMIHLWRCAGGLTAARATRIMHAEAS